MGLKVAFHSRVHVPVSIITEVDVLNDQLAQPDNRATEHLAKKDVFRPLSKSLFDSDPLQFEVNLRLSTRYCSTEGNPGELADHCGAVLAQDKPSGAHIEREARFFGGVSRTMHLPRRDSSWDRCSE